MRRLRLGCALVLISCWASVGLAQNPISLIPQSDVPLKPDYSYVFRTQAEVQAGKKFSGFASLYVMDGRVTPSDWHVSLEQGLIEHQANSNLASYGAWAGIVNNVIPEPSDPIHYQARVEAPAQPPIGVVTDPVTAEVPEELTNPNIVSNPPVILLPEADGEEWSHTTVASQHKLARINVLFKFLQNKPDVESGGRLRIAFDLYNFTEKKWVEKGAFLYPNYYQMSVMDLVSASVHFDNDDDFVGIQDVPPGNMYVKWRVRLTNENGLVGYGSREGTVEVWSWSPQGP